MDAWETSDADAIDDSDSRAGQVESPQLLHIVPPTPQNDAPDLHGQAVSRGSTTSYHLQPRPASYDAPSHRSRSRSSVSSMDSRLSTGTDVSGWSNVDTPGPFSEVEGISSTFGSSFPFDADGQHLARGRPAGAPWLSIDPRLFQSRSTSRACSESPPGNANEVVIYDAHAEAHVIDVDEDKEIVTAKPKSRSPRKTAEAKRGHGLHGQTGEAKKKVSHARKQHPEHIPRPRNAIILYRKHVVDSKVIPMSVELRHQNISVIVAKMWSEASDEEKAEFRELARIEKEEHLKKYPGYRYQPVYRRTNVIRRRVRKDDAEEEKCRSVAELLLKGKSGQELEAEIKGKVQRDTSPVPKKKKAKAGGANELSKGALRALRAQAARQSSPPSVDWSDASFSRATSLELNPAAQGSPYNAVAAHSSFSFGAGSSMAYRLPGSEMSYLADPDAFCLEGHHVNQSFGWDFGVTIGQGQPPVQQTYAYPQDLTEQGQGGYTYPQPFGQTALRFAQPIPHYYHHDHALPFSPTAGSFDQLQSHTQQWNQPYARQADMSLDPTMADSNDVMLDLQYPSPTSGLYSAGLSRPLDVPMSARWDRAHIGTDHHMLPSTSEVPLDSLFDTSSGMAIGMGIGMNDDLLNDFSAALAQTDDGGW